jgi:hypothetical protein
MAVYTSSDGGTCSSKLKSGKLGRLSQAVARYTEICGPVAHCWKAHQISRHRKHAQISCWLVGGLIALPENVLVNWVIRCDNHPEVKCGWNMLKHLKAPPSWCPYLCPTTLHLAAKHVRAWSHLQHLHRQTLQNVTSDMWIQNDPKKHSNGLFFCIKSMIWGAPRESADLWVFNLDKFLHFGILKVSDLCLRQRPGLS